MGTSVFAFSKSNWDIKDELFYRVFYYPYTTDLLYFGIITIGYTRDSLIQNNHKLYLWGRKKRKRSLNKKGTPLYNVSYDIDKKTKEVRIIDESSLAHTRWKCQYHVVIGECPNELLKEIEKRKRRIVSRVKRAAASFSRTKAVISKNKKSKYSLKIF